MTDVVVTGIAAGAVYGLFALGLVLVYKSNRFLNLAHAQLGTLSALLLAKFVIEWGWNWWVSFIAVVGMVADHGMNAKQHEDGSQDVAHLTKRR